MPHAQGVISHSDGDVVLHAIVDAVLGAMAAGDIGTHFPPSDEAWRDADVRALRGPRAQAPGGARRPPQPRGCYGHLPAAQDRPAPRSPYWHVLRTILGLDPARISLKATTTERLGFTGRGEGIAAQGGRHGPLARRRRR